MDKVEDQGQPAGARLCRDDRRLPGSRQLNQASSIYRGLNPFTGEDGTLTFAELTWAERLPPELLDRVRPTPTLPLPGIDWLDDVPQDLSRAVRSFLTSWYADVPVPRASRPRAPMDLPPPLLDFYEESPAAGNCSAGRTSSRRSA